MNMISRIIVSTLFLYISSINADIERVSVSSSGAQGNNSSGSASISADGRFVAFDSNASKLVDGDTNDRLDIFVHDRDTGLTERVSVSSSGAQGNSNSSNPSISADGRFVAFESYARNLVDGDTNGVTDIFLHDRDTGLTEHVSVSSSGTQGNNRSEIPSISGDGRYVAFQSRASNLVDGDTNGVTGIFLHDRDTGLTERVSVSSSGVPGNNFSNDPSISADGRFVAFESNALNLVEGYNNGVSNIFLHDRDTGHTERVSVSSSGVPGISYSNDPSISTDGRFVAFVSNASALVEGDTNGFTDIFVHDRDNGLTERVSLSSSGAQGNNFSNAPSISADGRYVAFQSTASTLVDGDTNGVPDIFVHDRDTGLTERVSVFSSGRQGNSYSLIPSISADARFMAFGSNARTLVDGDTNESSDVFVVGNSLLNSSDDLSVTLDRTSGVTRVGEYIRFRARLTNNSRTTMTHCRALLVNPLINYQREFSYYTYPLKIANPMINGAISIDPGEAGQMNLAVLPRVAMRRETSFKYSCDQASAFTIPFINTVHLTAKTEPLIAEDSVQLANSNKRTELEVDRNNGKYWTAYSVNASNTGTETARVKLTTVSSFSDAILRQPMLCEPVDPVNSDWSCITPRDTQIQVELEPNERKKILVFVHAWQSIDKQPVANRIYLEAHDSTGEVVAKTSMGISTIN